MPSAEMSEVAGIMSRGTERVSWGETMAKSLSELLEEIRDDIDAELKSTPDVVEKSADAFDVDKLPISKREWHKLDDVVAVAVDLKGSSKMSTGKHAAS